MATARIGLTVSCGRDNKMDERAILTLSPQFVRDAEPQTIEVLISPGDSAEDITARAVDAINRAGSSHEGASAVGSSTAVSTGTKPTVSGGQTATSTVVCMITVTDVLSIDVGCNDQKVRTFAVYGLNGDGGGGAGGGGEGGGTVVAPPGGKKPKEVDCSKYREQYEKDKKKAEQKAKGRRKPPSMTPPAGQPDDWFCDPRRDWKDFVVPYYDTPWRSLGPPDPERERRERTLVAAAPRIGVMVVGAASVTDLTFSALWGDYSVPEWLLVPFLEIRDSRVLQVREMQQRLAAAGVVTQDRSDGVIVPRRFIAGRLDGERVKAFGIGTAYDPLGYGGFAWTLIVGTADDVARHAAHAWPIATAIGSAEPPQVRPILHATGLRRPYSALGPPPGLPVAFGQVPPYAIDSTSSGAESGTERRSPPHESAADRDTAD